MARGMVCLKAIFLICFRSISESPCRMTAKPPKEKSFKADPVAFSNQLMETLDRLQPIVMEYAEKPKPQPSPDPLNMQGAFMHLFEQAMKNPQGMIDVRNEYLANMFKLWQEANKKFMGEKSEDVIRPEKGDKRFRDPLWDENVAFDFIKQSYLLTSQLMRKSISTTEGLGEHERRKLDFFTRQLVDSMSPTNFAMTNPEVLKATLNSQGQNLLKGFENLVSDLERGNGELQIRKTDYSAYEVGKNLAVTPGRIVYQNDLLQLIQYEPTTEKVFETPLLIIPPWINKYYILDMRPDNSLIKWAVDQGQTVFVISWVNPDERHVDKTFYSYIEEGLIAALDAIEVATGQKKTNVVGYCIGGTLLATALAYMTEKNTADRIASATFLTTLIDFTDAGDLQIFVDDAQLEAIETKMEEKGYLSGKDLRNTFSLLRANDLIWSYVINNYMLGKEPFQFDLLYWNDDSTNMPAKMHSFYLRNMYKDNLLCVPQGITINDTKIDVHKIKTPAYFLSTKEDHIAPWKATFEGMKLMGGDTTFILSASGHVAGVVNPPVANKYHYWSNGKIAGTETPDAWLDHASQTEGSWWSNWAEWLKKYSGNVIDARKPADGIEAAPGSYVKKKA